VTSGSLINLDRKVQRGSTRRGDGVTRRRGDLFERKAVGRMQNADGRWLAANSKFANAKIAEKTLDNSFQISYHFC